MAERLRVPGPEQLLVRVLALRLVLVSVRPQAPLAQPQVQVQVLWLVQLLEAYLGGCPLESKPTTTHPFLIRQWPSIRGSLGV